ncbi:divalent-cation tolerance protein CutA [Sphingomonas sp.]|uniref:divalent-cation tolerance protein CutA n=1 Tax=Sphingomonas sp. TaxID=28214 RepID=UPI0028A0A8A1|nr:divalent-cation tolerance protein CutA [Sphingomonas sp.]
MSADDLILVQCAAGSRDNAAAIAQALIEQRLAACVQVTPIESWYRWEGAVQHAPELMLTIKTVQSRFNELCRAVAALHDYDVPEIVAVPITDALPAYADWVRETVGAEG